MDHGYFQDRLSGYLDGELTPEETRAIAEHLQSCAECRGRLEDLRKFDRLVAEKSMLGDSEYWEQSARRIEARLEESANEPIDIRPAARRKSSGMWWKVSAVAASIVLVGYVGLYRDEILREVSGPAEVEQPAEPTPQSMTPGRSDSVAAPSSARGAVSENEAAAPKIPEHEETSDKAPQSLSEAPRSAELPVPTPTEPYAAESPVVSKAPPTPPTEPAKSRKAAPVSSLADKDAVASESATTPIEEPADIVKPMTLDKIALQAPEIAEVSDDHVGAGVDSAEPVQDLAYWRQIRDSLTAARDVADRKVDLGMTRPNWAEAARPSALRAEKSAAATSATEGRAPNSLLEAWFEICRLSPDSTESALGRHFLDSTAADTKSPSRYLAKDYVEQLDKR